MVRLILVMGVASLVNILAERLERGERVASQRSPGTWINMDFDRQARQGQVRSVLLRAGYC